MVLQRPERRGAHPSRATAADHPLLSGAFLLEWPAMQREGTFQLVSEFQPQGDQPQAIEDLLAGLNKGRGHQVLLGVTGSGKTFSMAHVIARANRPALIIAPNKTLAAQLYGEFAELFPHNAVRYFVSYYDYYQPEAYVPQSDTYIEKDASINEEIDKMRHSATKALLERRDTIIVASVSCIYGLGSPESYFDLIVFVEENTEVDRDALLRKLVDIQYQRNDFDFHRGTFRVRGDVVEVFPAYEESRAVRIEFFGDSVEGGGGNRSAARQGTAPAGQSHDLSGQPLCHHLKPDPDRSRINSHRTRAAA